MVKTDIQKVGEKVRKTDGQTVLLICSKSVIKRKSSVYDFLLFRKIEINIAFPKFHRGSQICCIQCEGCNLEDVINPDI